MSRPRRPFAQEVALADAVGLTRQTAVPAFQFGEGWINPVRAASRPQWLPCFLLSDDGLCAITVPPAPRDAARADSGR